jgi:hypothetical protein
MSAMHALGVLVGIGFLGCGMAFAAIVLTFETESRWDLARRLFWWGMVVLAGAGIGVFALPWIYS